MNSKLKTACGITAAVIIGGAFIGIGAAVQAYTIEQAMEEPKDAADFILPACPTEDSNNCYWDAEDQGNGQGFSFVTIDDVTYYLAPKGR